jgi:hypothetical protein
MELSDPADTVEDDRLEYQRPLQVPAPLNDSGPEVGQRCQKTVSPTAIGGVVQLFPAETKNGGSKWTRPPTDELLLDTVNEAKVKEDIKQAFSAYLFFINSNDKKHSQL